MNKVPLVIYHANCSDGFCAAYLLYRVFPDAEFVAAQYGDPPWTGDIAGRDVFVVDFSYPRDVLMKMYRDCKKLVVLDHHKTAAEACHGLHFCRFNMEQSGSSLVYKYLTEEGCLKQIEDIEWLVDYVTDRDLWRFDLPDSAIINAAIRSYRLTFADWDDLSELDSMDLACQGWAITRYRARLIEQHVANAREGELGGHSVMMVSCTCNELFSEIAEILAEDREFGVCYFDRQDGYRVFSLRSRGDFDVAKFAERFGGGGHARAAGFSMPNFP